MNINEIDSDRLDYFDEAFETDEYYAEWAEYLDTTSGVDPWADFDDVPMTYIGAAHDSEPPF